MLRFAWLPAVLILGCPEDTTKYWTPFNGDDNVVMVGVDPLAADAPPATADLSSTTGSVLVGTVSVDPGAAPVGTDHVVLVDVFEDFVEEVGRVTLETDAGARGVHTHELRQDSADHGLWKVTVTSMGDDGEQRTDTFRLTLWQPAEEGDEGAVETP